MSVLPIDLGDLLGIDEAGRRSLYESFIPQNVFGTQRRHLSGLFAPTFNRFLGELGQFARRDEFPERTFRTFLEEQYDPQRQLLRLPSLGMGGTSPVTPTIFNFPT